MRKRSLALAYVYDRELHESINRSGENFWEIYIREMNELLGVCAVSLPLAALEDMSKLKEIKTLLIGSQSGSRLTAKARQNLAAWVQEGGNLIGFAVSGLDEVFGIESRGTIKQEPDDYSISGYFNLLRHSITTEVHPFLFLEQHLLILSDIQTVLRKDSEELGNLYDTAGNDMNQSVITWRRFGKGYAGYFAFDVPKTVWLLHQGRPLYGINDGRNRRTYCLQVIGNNSRKVPYADVLVFLLQNMIAQNPQPFIYQIPPAGDRIPDALFYWSGDEYFGPTKLSLDASDFMKEKGLPYHINIGVEQHKGQKDGHPMTQNDFRHIRNNGHEISLWYKLFDEDNRDITEDLIKYQTDLFYERYGIRPVCTLMHSCNWQGWVEPARHMAKAGVKADNSFIPLSVPPLSFSHLNSAQFGFGFGTSYPFHFYESYEQSNTRLGFIEEPIICYEVGHRGSAITQELQDKETKASEEVHLPIDMAVKYHFVMNMFYHPLYIANFPRCREAIEEILRYIEYIGARVLHMGNDQVCEWWEARSRSTVNDLIVQENSIRFKCNCAYPSGMIVKIPVDGDSEFQVFRNGNAVPYQEKQEFGRRWIYVIVPSGEQSIKITGIPNEDGDERMS